MLYPVPTLRNLGKAILPNYWYCMSAGSDDFTHHTDSIDTSEIKSASDETKEYISAADEMIEAPGELREPIIDERREFISASDETIEPIMDERRESISASISASDEMTESISASNDTRGSISEMRDPVSASDQTRESRPASDDTLDLNRDLGIATIENRDHTTRKITGPDKHPPADRETRDFEISTKSDCIKEFTTPNNASVETDNIAASDGTSGDPALLCTCSEETSDFTTENTDLTTINPARNETRDRSTPSRVFHQTCDLTTTGNETQNITALIEKGDHNTPAAVETECFVGELHPASVGTKDLSVTNTILTSSRELSAASIEKKDLTAPDIFPVDASISSEDLSIPNSASIETDIAFDKRDLTTPAPIEAKDSNGASVSNIRSRNLTTPTPIEVKDSNGASASNIRSRNLTTLTPTDSKDSSSVASNIRSRDRTTPNGAPNETKDLNTTPNAASNATKNSTNTDPIAANNASILPTTPNITASKTTSNTDSGIRHLVFFVARIAMTGSLISVVVAGAGVLISSHEDVICPTTCIPSNTMGSMGLLTLVVMIGILILLAIFGFKRYLNYKITVMTSNVLKDVLNSKALEVLLARYGRGQDASKSQKGSNQVISLSHTTTGHDTPTLKELISFPVTADQRVNVAEQIGTHYYEFGILILDDRNGSRVSATKDMGRNLSEINRELLRQWLEGGGTQPVTWATLIMILRDIGLNKLANDIAKVKV